MEVFISELFLDKLSDIEKGSPRNVIVTVDKIERIVTSNLKISCNISIENAKNYYDVSGSKSFDSIKQGCIHNAIKNGTYTYNDLTFEENNNNKAIYFYDKSLPNKNNLGLVYIDTENKFDYFFGKCTVNSNPLKDDYEIIEDAAPPCNSMLIVDKYIFFEPKKIKNLIRFINAYNNKELKIPFHLSIISSYENMNKSLPPKNIRDAVSELDLVTNLNYGIYLDNRIPLDDRAIYTNYTKGSIGHPFDDRKTVFNQNFMATSERINKDYDDYLIDLKEWKNFIIKIPKTMGIIQTKYLNKIGFENRLFDSI